MKRRPKEHGGLWPDILLKPNAVSFDDWFVALARQLLHGSRIVVAGRPHRLVEVECYCFSDGHRDPFTHCHPLQSEPGHWYFHRSGGSYRNGSFKGLDLTIGTEKAGHGGVLIRSIETPDGRLIAGPSLVVDHLLSASGYGSVADLDRAIGGRRPGDSGSELCLKAAEARGDGESELPRIYRSARIGLTLKRRKPDAADYLLRPYRFLTEPRRIGKGRLHLALALHMAGQTPEQIAAISGSPRRSIQRYIAEFEAGRQQRDFASYVGLELGPTDLCRLHGVWVQDFAFGLKGRFCQPRP
jgi:3-methyladenine DNA glycosylase Mpg